MEIQEFIEKFADAIDVNNVEVLTAKTEFHELEEWSSLSVMLAIAFFEKEFGKHVSNTEIREANTLLDLYNIVAA